MITESASTVSCSILLSWRIKVAKKVSCILLLMAFMFWVYHPFGKNNNPPFERVISTNCAS